MDAVIEILKGLDYSPLYVSLKTGIVATIFSFFLGLFAARKVIKAGPKVKAIADGILTLPMVLPPTAAGFFLLLLFSRRRPFGILLYEEFGIKVVQTWAGCIIAATVIAFPLMYRNARAAFEQIDVNLIHAARTLGMPEYKIFWKVAVPSAGPGLVAGTILTFARALGEYGATSMLAGNIPGKTGTISQRIAMVIQDGDYMTAGIWVVIIMLVAFVLIFLMNLVTGRNMKNIRRWYDSESGTCLKPQKRNVGYMFQNYALFPAMTVAQNVGAGLSGDKKKKQEQVEKMIRHFHLEGLEKRLPRELSGGQQQRVALARIMAYEPSVILLDEPFSALDVFLKDRLQQEMMELLSDYDGTVILVSHSRDEIYRFSEELLIIDDGKQICYGDTKEIFDHPKKVEAARLTGCKNIVPAERLDAHHVRIPDWGTCLHLKQMIDVDITHIGLRAHEFIPVWGEREDNCIPVKVKGKAEFPFEWKYFLKGETEESDDICWYVQKTLWAELEEKGIPEYLKLPEKEILLLK